MSKDTRTPTTKWTDKDFDYPVKIWKPPKKLLYPCFDTERSALEQLITDFAPLPPYDTSSVLQGMQPAAETQKRLVSVPYTVPKGYHAFLESTAEQCISRETKHGEPTHSAKNWILRVDTLDGIVKRLINGYSISGMFGERCGQYIRNSRNWRGNTLHLLDIDDWRETVKSGSIEYEIEQMHFDGLETETIEERTAKERVFIRRVINNAMKPEPCFSEKELFERYPLLPRICTFIMPSASSLIDGRPFKARGVIRYLKPITDRRVFHAFGDLLLTEIDCIPANVTKNAISIGFGNTQNAEQAYCNDSPDTDWIQTAIAKAQEAVIAENSEHLAKREQQRKRKQAYQQNAERNGYATTGNTGTGENITVFLQQCDPLAEMMREGLLFHVHGNRYKWKDSDSESSCEYIDADGGYFRIYSASMQAAGPKASGNGAIAAHRFYLYDKTGLDLSSESKSEKAAIRDYLFSQGYGSDPAAFRAQHRKPKLPPLAEVLRDDAAALERTLANAPEPNRYGCAYNHFTTEQKQLIRADGYDPMLQYHEVKDRIIPAWVPKYEKLNPLFPGSEFAMNGQPADAEKHRVYFSRPLKCDTCEKESALYWIDRFRHISGKYCDTCHKDLDPHNSLLRLELNRPLTHHYISDDAGYVSDDPYWKTTPLWSRGRFTYLAAAMNTGKTTYANAKGVEHAKANNGDFILCVPRVSLAKEQWHLLTEQYGEGSFGLFHEGSRKSVGRLGAVCCLSSLSNVFGYEDYQTGDAYDIDNAWIFIDEMDYAYQLLQLLSPVARETKHLLEKALHTKGLVVAGQTEWTAAIENFAAELETDQTLGYYKPVEAHETPTEIVVYPDVEGKNAWALSEMIDYIREILDAGLHAYCFCATRRDVAVLRQEFIELSPLTFTSLSKNTARAKKFLANGTLTDTPLFIATSAAAVGISIHDPKARTAILAGLVHGKLNCADIVQERVRDRGQNAGRIFLPTYQNAFPVTQTDATKISRYEAEKKRIAAELSDADLKNADKLAATYALNTLAEDDPLTFITHHLQNIAGFSIECISPSPACESAIQHIKDNTKITKEKERTETEKIALEVIDAEIKRCDATDDTPPAIKTTSEVRTLPAVETVVLGNKAATHAAILVGFDDQTDIARGNRNSPQKFDWRPADLEIVRKLIAAGVDTTDWKQKFLGYLAARHPAESDTQWEIAQGTGSELSAIRDYHFIGKLLAEIIDALAGTHWEQEALAAKLQNALNTEIDAELRVSGISVTEGYEDTQLSTGATYLSEIQRGVIGVKIWRKARYLNVSKTPVKFCLELITDFYPCSVKQHKGVFSIHDEKHLDLFNDALNAFLYHQNSAEETDIGFTDTPIGQTLTVQKLPEIDTPKQALYAEVKKLFADDVSIVEIVDRTGVSRRKVFDVTKCQRIRKDRNADAELRDRAEKELERGASLTATAKTLGISRRKLKRILETVTGAKVQKNH